MAVAIGTIRGLCQKCIQLEMAVLGVMAPGWMVRHYWEVMAVESILLQWELFCSFLDTMCVIIHLNSCYCFPTVDFLLDVFPWWQCKEKSRLSHILDSYCCLTDDSKQ